MQITLQDIKNVKSLTEREIINVVMNKYHIQKDNVTNAKLVKKSLDIRDKNNPYYVYQLVFELNEKERKNKYLKDKKVKVDTNFSDEINVPIFNDAPRPIVIGFGPAGMFSAYLFALANMRPIIFERGTMVEEREKDIEDFFKKNNFKPNSNVCFGEGGAGTFSDGKLNTTVNDPKIKFILKKLVELGAKESVYYDGKPHVGTDKLRVCVKNLREEIISLGGEFHFKSQVIDVKSNEVTVDEEGIITKYNSPYIVLAIGHSAKDTYEMLYKNGFNLEPKPFSMGCRIEHLQKTINDIQYGENSNIHDPASYKAAVHLDTRDVYSFCMCPGGFVVASNSDYNEIVTNGMSYEARDGVNANSAILVNVKVEDFYNGNPLDGIYYQSKIEKACYELTNSYKAPCNLLKEFINDEIATSFRSVKPTYSNGLVFSSFDNLLPKYIIDGLKEGIKAIDNKMHGFLDDDAILTIVESRSSSPVRIVRKDYESNIKGVYPIGEGAGYAGGITSSALDGIKCAYKIFENINGGDL